MLALKPTLVFVTFLTFINVGESKKLVGSFQTHTHDVRGEVYFTDDETTLEIKDFYYDGKYTLKHRYNEPRNSEFLDIVNKTHLPF